MTRARICSALVATAALALASTVQLPAAGAAPTDPELELTVWTWGENRNGQLGDGTTTDHWFAAPATATPPVVDADVGYEHNVTLRADGTVWTWGGNSFGQLGDGTTVDRATPVQVDLDDVVAVSAGTDFTLALTSDGSVWSWGANEEGQLGDKTRTDRSLPVQVTKIKNITAISGGGENALALTRNGTVWAWGTNKYGQLGDGSLVPRRAAPRKTTGLVGVAAISAGSQHNLVLHADGTLSAWGDDNFGQLGDGEDGDSRRVPGPVPGLTDIEVISAGGLHSHVIDADGTVYSWGFNFDGRLGDGTTIYRYSPVVVPGLDDAVAVSAGGTYGLAALADGTTWAWGDNFYGQLGDGTKKSRSVPTLVQGLQGATVVRAGYQHSVALVP